jgi:hypothetical protein
LEVGELNHDEIVPCVFFWGPSLRRLAVR